MYPYFYMCGYIFRCIHISICVDIYFDVSIFLYGYSEKLGDLEIFFAFIDFFINMKYL